MEVLTESKRTQMVMTVTVQMARSAPRDVEVGFPMEGLDEVKRKVVQECRLPSRKAERYAFYGTLLGRRLLLRHEEDWRLFVAATIVQKKERCIIEVETLHKRSRRQMYTFDDGGKVRLSRLRKFAQEPEEEDNRPSDPIYSGAEPVQCAFCRVSSTSQEDIKTLGPLYGPFWTDGFPFFAHELCAIWTPDVFLDRENRLQNVIREVRRCERTSCSHCGVQGGGLGCLQPRCKKTYHFRCLLDESLDVVLDYQKFTMYCPDHCTPHKEPWDYESVFCCVCNEGGDDDKCLLCDDCDEAYHTYCLSPPLSEVPEGAWFCSQCSVKP